VFSFANVSKHWRNNAIGSQSTPSYAKIQFEKKRIREQSNNVQSWCHRLMPIFLAIREAEIRRITIRGQSRRTVRKTPLSKITRAKWTGDVAQEHLLYKHEAQSWKPQPTKQTNKKPCRVTPTSGETVKSTYI
jgi:hypothetical protein